MSKLIKAFFTEPFERLSLTTTSALHYSLSLVRCERFLLRKLLRNFKHGENWTVKNSLLEPNIKRYLATPYRPHFSNDFEAERDYLELAIAAANVIYYVDFDQYIKLVDRIQAYLTIAGERDNQIRNTSIWADNCHHRATIRQVLGDASEAARLNSEAARIYNELRQDIDTFTHLGCTACCRIETLTLAELHLIEAASKRVEEQHQYLFSRYKENKDDQHIKQSLFQFSLLNCKIECHKTNPDPKRIRNYIESISDLDYGTGSFDKPTYKMAIDFYTAIAMRLENRPVPEVRSMHRSAIDAVRDRGARGAAIDYCCFTVIPQNIEQMLCNYSQIGPLKKSIDELYEFRTNTRRLRIRTLFGWLSVFAITFLFPPWREVGDGSFELSSVVFPISIVGLFCYFFTLSWSLESNKISPLAKNFTKLSRDLAFFLIVPSLAFLN